MILSPFKQKLVERSGPFSSLEKRNRNVFACGAQSLVLTEGLQHVLVITQTSVAKNIELLRDVPDDETLFSKPKVVGINVDVGELLDPDSPLKAKNNIKKNHGISYPHLLTKNVVYLLPRYDGTLEDLSAIRFQQHNIDDLNRTLNKALKVLHQHNITHNDLSLKNIFYKGQYPNIEFFLGDFGSLTNNEPKKHAVKCATDLSRLKRLIDKAQQILGKKENFAEKTRSTLSFVPAYSARQQQLMNTTFKKMRVSPQGDKKKAAESTITTTIRQSVPKKLFRTF